MEQVKESLQAAGCAGRMPGANGAGLKPVVLELAIAFAVTAGISDLCSRRIPNWLTVPGLLVGIAANAAVSGWSGVEDFPAGSRVGIVGAVAICDLARPGRGRLEVGGSFGSFCWAAGAVGFAGGLGFRGWIYGACAGDLQAAIQGNAAEHRTVAGLDVNFSQAGV